MDLSSQLLCITKHMDDISKPPSIRCIFTATDSLVVSSFTIMPVFTSEVMRMSSTAMSQSCLSSKCSCSTSRSSSQPAVLSAKTPKSSSSSSSSLPTSSSSSLSSEAQSTSDSSPQLLSKSLAAPSLISATCDAPVNTARDAALDTPKSVSPTQHKITLSSRTVQQAKTNSKSHTINSSSQFSVVSHFSSIDSKSGPSKASPTSNPVRSPLKMTSLAALLLTLLVSLQAGHTDARSVGVCRGIPCANGGRLLVSNSIWGNCRCRCRSGFVGPYCQYRAAYKRSGASSSSAAPTVAEREAATEIDAERIIPADRLETMELIRQQLLDLAAMPEPDASMFEPTDIFDNNTDFEESSVGGDESEEIIIRNISRRAARREGLGYSRLLKLISTLKTTGSLKDQPKSSGTIYRSTRVPDRTWRSQQMSPSLMEVPSLFSR